ncbi:MAG: transporter [Polyangiales bacterium]
MPARNQNPRGGSFDLGQLRGTSIADCSHLVLKYGMVLPKAMGNLRLTVALLFVCLFVESNGVAQTMEPFSVERLRVAPGYDDGLSLQLPTTINAGEFHARLLFAYQDDPLVLLNASTSARVGAPIHQRVSGDLVLGYGIHDRVNLYAQLPTTLWQDGDTVSISKSGAGDLSIGAKLRLVGNREGFAVGLTVALVEPTGKVAAFNSDNQVAGRTTLSLAYSKARWRVGANVGADLRAKRQYYDYTTGSDLTFAAGASFDPLKPLRLGAELFGTTRFDKDLFFRNSAYTHLETAGVLTVMPSERWAVRAGGSLGILRAVGTPTYRFLDLAFRLGLRSP